MHIWPLRDKIVDYLIEHGVVDALDIAEAILGIVEEDRVDFQKRVEQTILHLQNHPPFTAKFPETEKVIKYSYSMENND